MSWDVVGWTEAFGEVFVVLSGGFVGWGSSS